MAQDSLPDRVTFPSLDGHTQLVGYVYAPRAEPGHPATTGPAPAVVMMHGRAGAYSSLANGKYDATTISQRHRMWGELWAAQGYVAILVDGFGPRGYPHGFPRYSYGQRPAELDEVIVRPLDAYGAIHVALRAGANPTGTSATSFRDLISMTETSFVCSSR